MAVLYVREKGSFSGWVVVFFLLFFKNVSCACKMPAFDRINPRRRNFEWTACSRKHDRSAGFVIASPFLYFLLFIISQFLPKACLFRGRKMGERSGKIFATVLKHNLCCTVNIYRGSQCSGCQL